MDLEKVDDGTGLRWKWALGICILWVGFVAASVAACGAGFLRPEAFTFLPHYLQHRPWYEIVFDPAGTDLATYQARELGHALTFFDSQFVLWSVIAGHPHFFSASHYLLLLACGFLIWQIAVRSLNLSGGVALGLIALLWTSPTAFLFSSYYRPGKIGLCFGTLLFAAVWFSFRGTPEVARRRETQLLVWLGIAGVMLPMYDKQGLAFLFVATIFAALRAVITQVRKDRSAFLVLCGALLIALIYNWSIGPQLTRRFSESEPDLTYQSLPMAQFFHEPRHIAIVLFGAPLMAVNSLQFVAGNLSMGVFLAGLAGAWWMFAQARPKGVEPWPRVFHPARLYLALLFVVWGLFVVLLIRSPLMFTNEHRRFFYGASLSAVWIVGLAVTAATFQHLWPARRSWLAASLAVLLIGNVFAIPDHRFVLRQGLYATYRQNARHLTYMLHPERIAKLGVDPAHARELLAAAPAVVEGSPPGAARNPIYLVLLAEYWERTKGANASPK